MRSVLLLLFFVSAADAQTVTAEIETIEQPRFAVKLGLGYQARFERVPGNTGEQTETLSVPSFFAQLDYQEFQLHSEYQRMSTASGSGAYAIKSDRQELLLIARYRYLMNQKWSLFGGLGGGLGRETIKTSYASSSVTSKGDTEKISVLDAGLQVQFTKRFFSEFGIRGLKIENLEPWVLALGLRAGLRL